MADEAEVIALLDQFRAGRREFTRRLFAIPSEERVVSPAPGRWSARDFVAAIAAWLEEANDRVPRLLAGAPRRDYDVDRFNADAVARAAEWTPEMALAAFRRAADRFEAIIGETDAADIVESEDALAWLRGAVRMLMAQRFA